MADELLVAVEIPVKRGRRHAHLAGDRAQRDRGAALLDKQPPRDLDDLLAGRGAQAIAPAQNRDIGRHSRTPSPFRLSELTTVNVVWQVYTVTAYSVNSSDMRSKSN